MGTRQADGPAAPGQRACAGTLQGADQSGTYQEAEVRCR
jgi:hypothetical protein